MTITPILLYQEVPMIIAALVIGAVIVIIDQVIKYFISTGLKPIGEYTVIENLFALRYVENRGVAFGMFQGMFWFFSVMTVVFIGIFIYMIVKRIFKGRLFYISSALIIGGGIGNLIDRVFRGYVIDYLSFSFFSPVFNFADCCVTIGAVLMIISVVPSLRAKEHE